MGEFNSLKSQIATSSVGFEVDVMAKFSFSDIENAYMFGKEERECVPKEVNDC